MKLYTEGKILNSDLAETFKDENGQDVVYSVNVIRTKDGEIAEVNSQRNYKEDENKSGVVVFNARKQEGQKNNIYKLSLAGFEEGQSIETDVEIA